ncbi:MAG: hypothetical protein CVU44_12450 [Chloroflexi bacterium HGW-Chloroflexi-6]|nr:MAG: hypothetical protein CVU44_12450 [Chloroflexi bacterium HGW-Chloroflexi-6]
MKLSHALVRVWYARLFVLLFLGASYFLLIRSSDGGIFGFDSSFWGQSKLIARFADLRLTIGDRVFPNVLVGEDGWLIFTAEGSLEDYQNSFKFSDEQIVTITNQLAELQSRLAARGAILLVVIAPNKPTIYPEIVPSEIEKLSDTSRLERLTVHLQQNLPGILLDLRPTLSDGQAVRDVYYKTDTHWNDYGILLAYQAILQELAKSRPELAPYPLEMFELKEGQPELWDLAANTGGVSLREPSLTVSPKFDNPAEYRQLEVSGRKLFTSWVADDKLPRLLMYHDSFAPRLFSLLGMHFSSAVSVPHYSGRPIWSLNWIDQQQPDVVIIEFAERYLHDLETLLSQ